MYENLRASNSRLLSIVGALGLAAAACGGAADVQSVGAQAGESASQSASPSAESPSLLSGEFATLSGGSVDLDSLQGENVVLWFWAPW